jgi:hypothetical protein
VNISLITIRMMPIDSAWRIPVTICGLADRSTRCHSRAGPRRGAGRHPEADPDHGGHGEPGQQADHARQYVCRGRNPVNRQARRSADVAER